MGRLDDLKKEYSELMKKHPNHNPAPYARHKDAELENLRGSQGVDEELLYRKTRKRMKKLATEMDELTKKTEADKELIRPELEEIESRFPALSRVLSEAEEDVEQPGEVCS